MLPEKAMNYANDNPRSLQPGILESVHSSGGFGNCTTFIGLQLEIRLLPVRGMIFLDPFRTNIVLEYICSECIYICCSQKTCIDVKVIYIIMIFLIIYVPYFIKFFDKP